MLGKILIPLLLSTSISAKYLTITAGSSDVTTTQCRTIIGVTSLDKVPTYTLSRTALLPEITLALAVSTPGSTVTPPAITATNTLQTYTTATVTASTATGTFSTTTTVYETDSITTTDTVLSTTTSTTTATGTSTHVVPAPSDWINVTNSTGYTETGSQAGVHDSSAQQLLQDSGTRVKGGWPPKIPKPPGFPDGKSPWENKHPLSVTCFQTVRTHYIKKVIFVKPYTTTTTLPPATSTITSTQTIESTSTIVPDKVTVIKSFSTTSTTTTTFASVITDTSTTTEQVNATLTSTSYAACGTDNILGPKLPDGRKLAAASINDYVAGQQDTTLQGSEYDCCVSCLLDEASNCQYSVTLYYMDPPACGRLLNPAVCRGQDYEAGEIRVVPGDDENETGVTVSNGPCGVMGFDEKRELNDPSSEVNLEL
ncbi:MAG: hypothetical protein Q9174_004230 [Haloplaca sp. 1 TL-2023]